MDYVINWQNEGAEIKSLRPGERRSYSILPAQYRFRDSVTWTDITGSMPHYRYRPGTGLYDIKGMCCFPDESAFWSVLGFCNSSVATSMLSFLSPTMNTQVGDVGKMPVLFADCFENEAQTTSLLVKDCVEISRNDWDLFETSWDFKRHPLI